MDYLEVIISSSQAGTRLGEDHRTGALVGVVEAVKGLVVGISRDAGSLPLDTAHHRVSKVSRSTDTVDLMVGDGALGIGTTRSRLALDQCITIAAGVVAEALTTENITHLIWREDSLRPLVPRIRRVDVTSSAVETRLRVTDATGGGVCPGPASRRPRRPCRIRSKDVVTPHSRVLRVLGELFPPFKVSSTWLIWFKTVSSWCLYLSRAFRRSFLLQQSSPSHCSLIFRLYRREDRLTGLLWLKQWVAGGEEEAKSSWWSIVAVIQIYWRGETEQ